MQGLRSASGDVVHILQSLKAQATVQGPCRVPAVADPPDARSFGIAKHECLQVIGVLGGAVRPGPRQMASRLRVVLVDESAWCPVAGFA